MSDNTLTTVFHIVSEVSAVNLDALREDTTFSELNLLPEDYYEIYEACCEECNVPLNQLLNSMPVYRIGAGECVMSSLRNLAAFFDKADALLEIYDVQEHDETLKSLTESLQAQRYVPSGRFLPRLNPARTKRYVVSLAVGLFVAALILPYLVVRLECDVICTLDPQRIWSRTMTLMPYTVGLALFFNAVAFIPGFLALRSRRAQRKLNQNRTWRD